MTEDFGKIKKLGFGLMRLPKLDDGKGAIDVEQTKKMVDMFFEAGFNYFDTAFVYPGSEEATKLALVDRYPRDSYFLATKMAAWAKCEKREDAIEQFNTSLKRTGAGYFDFYLMHNLGSVRTKPFDDFGLWDWAKEQKKEGKIRHIGFSFHAKSDELEQILDAHPEAEFVQLQINYADWESPTIQSRKNYETVVKHGRKVIVMEPVKGGMLATPPESVTKIFKAADPAPSLASWAVKFAADLDGVLTVLSGMSSVEQMADNVSYMKDFHGLSDAQRKLYDEARAELAKIPLIPCTSCDYCAKVCPADIGISGSFTAMNNLTLYKNKSLFVRAMDFLAGRKKMPSECIKCGACESACPQSIAIRSELEKIAAEMK